MREYTEVERWMLSVQELEAVGGKEELDRMMALATQKQKQQA